MATPRFSPEVGGVENHVLALAQRLPDQGVDVVVVTAAPERGSPTRERVGGVSVVRVPAWPHGGDLRLAPSLSRTLRAQAVDLVHVESYHTLIGPLAMASALASRTPYVVTFHGGGHSSPIRSRIRPAQLFALRPLLRRSAKLVASARFEIDSYGRILGLDRSHFAYIPNGSDLPTLSEPPVADPNLIVSSGRLERYKGHHRAIEALPYVLARTPQARLWIAGSGPYEGELRKLAAKLGIADRVEIRVVPGVDRIRFAEELSRASVAVLLSDFETNPLSGLEAVALGVPLVVRVGSGLTELVTDGLAAGVPRDAPPQAIATAILDAMRGPKPPRRPSLITWDECARLLADLYRSILAASP